MLIKLSLRLHELISHIHAHPGSSLPEYTEACEIIDILRRNRCDLYFVATRQIASVDWNEKEEKEKVWIKEKEL